MLKLQQGIIEEWERLVPGPARDRQHSQTMASTSL